MAYGTPRNLSEVEPFYRDIRGGRAPSPKAVEELTERYRMVGGKTPLLEITMRVAGLLRERLTQDASDTPWNVYVGMKHWHPFIAEAIDQIASDGVAELVSLPLAPHYSKMSIAGYEELVVRNLKRIPSPPNTRFIQSWHANPLFMELIANRIRDALPGFPVSASDVEVLFTAHSLPSRILDYGDPYPAELMESAAAAALAAKVDSWRFAYQSAGMTGASWLGPDILDSIEEISREGKKNILVVPFGFVCDHLEISFDIDIEAIEKASELGVNLARIELPNDSPAFIETLYDLVTVGRGARISELSVGG